MILMKHLIHKLKSSKYIIRQNWSLMWQMSQNWCSKRAAFVYVTALFSVSLLHREKTEGNYRQYGLPDLLKGLFLGTCGLAGSHLLSMSFLSWPQTAIKKERKGLGQTVQLVMLCRKEVGYPRPLKAKNQDQCQIWFSAGDWTVERSWILSMLIECQ